MVGVRGWERRERGVMGTEFPFGKMKKFFGR